MVDLSGTVPNPLADRPSDAIDGRVAVQNKNGNADRLKVLAVEKLKVIAAEKAKRANNEATNTAVAALQRQQQRPSVQHHQHQQQPAPGMFGFNPMLGIPSYFHPGMTVPPTDAKLMTTSFSLHPNQPGAFPTPASVPTAAKSTATSASAPPASQVPTPLFSDAKRKNDAILQYQMTKKQRQQSSSSTTTNSAVKDLTAQQKGKSGGRVKLPDPPGFEAFQRDTSFIKSIMANRMKENGNTDPLLGPLARGIINMSDEDIFKLSNDDNDATLKAFVADVIMPLLGIDENIARSNYSAWQGYAHISSENLRSVAKNFFYVRRSSMKAAVQVAFYEMKKNHLKIIQAGGGGGGGEKSNSVHDESSAAARRIQQLERALKKQKEDNAKMTKQIEEIYENDIADMRNDHKLHIEELKQAHKKEVEALKEEMEDMKCSHREFLGHYVEAAAEAVRLAQKQRKPSSFGRAVSDL